VRFQAKWFGDSGLSGSTRNERDFAPFDTASWFVGASWFVCASWFVNASGPGERHRRHGGYRFKQRLAAGNGRLGRNQSICLKT
jgi:hypothetical protein